MCEHQRNTERNTDRNSERTTGPGGTEWPAHGFPSEWAHRATKVRAAEWSSDRVLDPGDTHDKGERSLCVGEAA
jgi:hypothetical protein